MKRLTALFSLATVGVVIMTSQRGFAQQPPLSSDLNGKWALTWIQVDGKTQLPNSGNPFYLTFTGNRCQVGNAEGAYRLRLDRQPKEIDLMLTDKDGKPYTLPGIYDITGDTLTLCLPGTNWNRPTQLRTDMGDGWRLHRFTLVRTVEPGKSPPLQIFKPGSARTRNTYQSAEPPAADSPSSCGCGPNCACSRGGSDTLSKAMRKLWEDHITWTRVYIISALAGLPDKSAATTRLLRNQDDIGDAIKPYYGNAAGAKLTALLKQHILISADVVDAAKAGDTARQQAATKRWYANADELAAFLNSANPQYWPLEEMKAMFYEHLKVTTAEVLASLRMDWPGDVAAYDQVHNQALMMADTLSSGIARQFPNQLRGGRPVR